MSNSILPDLRFTAYFGSDTQVLPTAQQDMPVHAHDSLIPHSSPAQPTGSSSSPRAHSGRRGTPHIALAPDQPPTTQGRPRTRVFLACVYCRNRKIRCDGAKPVCHNCGLRTGGGPECSYDPVPKRRGPDRTPGRRQRAAWEDEEHGESALPQKRRRRRREGGHSVERDAQQAGQERSREHSQSARASSSETLPSEDHYLPAIAPAPDPNPDPRPFPPFSLDIPSILHASPPALTSSVRRALFMPLATDLELALPPQLEDFDAERGHLARLLGRPEAIHMDDDPEWDAQALLTPSASFLALLFASMDGAPALPAQPSLDFTRKTWWDALLSLYTDPFAPASPPLGPAQRTRTTCAVAAELRFFFRSANNWLSFFHLPTFFAAFGAQRERERMQPALVLALLAAATFFQSSEVGKGAEGRHRARRFADEAQGALEASINGGWFDEQLAQAAYLLALFEACPHPMHSWTRATAALRMLDNILRSLALPLLDAGAPGVCTFEPRAVPALPPADADAAAPLRNAGPATSGAAMVRAHALQRGASAPVAGCACAEYSLGHRWPPAQEHAPLWLATPGWDAAWEEAEIKREGCRRLCWSALQLVAARGSVTSAWGPGGIDLWIADPANFALLLPCEPLISSPSSLPLHPSSPQNSAWALYARAMLLWQGCLRMRGDAAASAAERAQFGVQAWLEADRLEDALGRHTCGVERAYMYQGREYLFNTRMCISHEFQNYIPLPDLSGDFHRNMAEAWLETEHGVATRLMEGLHTVTGLASNVLARRPFFAFWFMAQVSRSLLLWHKDPSLSFALDVAKAFLLPIEYLSELWPCPEQHAKYLALHDRVVCACRAAGAPEPPPPPPVVARPAELKI